MTWYYALGNERQGPIDDAALDRLIATGVVTQDTLVWKAGMADWQPLAQARPRAAAPPTPVIPPPPAAITPAPAAEPDTQPRRTPTPSARRRRRGRRGGSGYGAGASAGGWSAPGPTGPARRGSAPRAARQRAPHTRHRRDPRARLAAGHGQPRPGRRCQRGLPPGPRRRRHPVPRHPDRPWRHADPAGRPVSSAAEAAPRRTDRVRRRLLDVLDLVPAAVPLQPGAGHPHRHLPDTGLPDRHRQQLPGRTQRGCEPAAHAGRIPDHVCRPPSTWPCRGSSPRRSSSTRTSASGRRWS